MLEDSGLLEEYAKHPDSELNAQEKLQRDALTAARRALNNMQRENRELVQQLADERAKLATAVAGKAVLVGWIATAAFDVVTTSLHARAPGVIESP